ncbi:MAG TPA: hypothetical protein VK174_13430 [Chitinophagales bacterium]|nr:hypothetical protein [Chitinophagales bacterium]
MNKLLVITLCLLSLQVFSQEKKYKVGVIAFYNLENFFDTINDPAKNDEDFTPAGANAYTSKVYEDKVRKLTEVLSQIGTDVSPDGFSLLGVAEIENTKVLEDLCAQPEFAKRHLKIVHFDGPDDRSIDPALIYNPRYFKVLHSEPLFVRMANPDGSLHYTRDVLWVSGLYDGEPLHVFVNHWPSRRGGDDASAPARAAAAGVGKRVIDSLMKIDPNTKVVLMGDLNDDPTSPSVTEVLGAKTKMGDVKDGGLYNPWNDFLKRGIGTLAYQDSWNLFDQIIISSAFLNKEQSGFFYRGAHIFNRNFMVAKTGKYKGYPMRTYDGAIYNGGYSDHFPTYLIMLKEVK